MQNITKSSVSHHGFDGVYLFLGPLTGCWIWWWWDSNDKPHTHSVNRIIEPKNEIPKASISWMVEPLQRRSTNDQGGTLDDVCMSVHECACVYACMSCAEKLPNRVTLVIDCIVWLPSHPGVLFSHPKLLPKNTSPVWDVVLLVK